MAAGGRWRFCGQPGPAAMQKLRNAGSRRASRLLLSRTMAFHRTFRLLSLAAALCSAGVAAIAAEAPKLAVVISVDQFRGDYLARFGPYFGEGGFKRLLTGGLHFTNCHYRHSVMLTAPGHASILSGTFASVHGVTSNEWLDRATWEQVNSVEDKASPLVGITPAELGPAAAAAPAKTGRSPANFKAETVGDELKKKFGTGTKIFAASNKDRSAILLGGGRGDAAYWDENGLFVTSRRYRPTGELPAWVAAFNAENRAGKAFGRVWDRLLPAEVYEKVQGPDNAPGETDAAGLGTMFPRRVDGGKKAVSSAYYTAYDNSPFTTESLGEFVRRAITEEKLGRNTGTDLLCVSFSQVDTVGHNYGPDSHEVMDSVLRLDRVLAGVLDTLDREVGLANCVIVLTADHGVVPLPERTSRTDPATGAARVRTTEMDAAARKALDARFGALPTGEAWFTRDNAGVHLRPTALAAKQADAAEAAKLVKEAFAKMPFVADVFTRAELLAAGTEGNSPLTMMRRSYRAESDRDVVYTLKPWFIAKAGTGSGHGQPYPYDQHVAMLWFGAGVPRGERTERVHVDQLAPTLAGLLGVPAPAAAKSPRLF